jgi:hypothetical protein
MEQWLPESPDGVTSLPALAEYQTRRDVSNFDLSQSGGMTRPTCRQAGWAGHAAGCVPHFRQSTQ